MLGFIEFIVLLGCVGALAFYRVKPLVWTTVMGLVLIAFSGWSDVSWLILIPAWIIYLACATLFNMTDLRTRIFSQKMFDYFKRLLPPISRTEQEALDAGDVWWERDLFQGNPDWNKFAAYGKPVLTAEEQAFMDGPVNTLCQMLDSWQIEQEREIPENVWAYMRQQGFFGLAIDKKYGGRAFSAYAHSSIVAKISSRSLSAAVSVMVPNSLGPAELVYHYGTDEQKEYYLPRLASGEDIPCFGLTAPTAGSDAGAIPDKGVVCKGTYEGKETLGIRLSWDKRYITLAPIATVLGLAFKLYDPEKLLGDKLDLGITVCLIPTTHPGVEIGLRHFPAGLAFMNGPTRGKDVFIPMDFIIGGQENVGRGWQMLMASLSIGRSISLPALSSAAARLSYAMTGAYARIRKQFKLPIAEFEGVEEALANIAGKSYLVEATRSMTASAVDLGVKPAIASALTKYHTTELARKIIDDAMDVHGGRAVQYGPSNYLAFAHQGIPVSITVEGANILTRNLIVFGQGVMRCHPFIEEEIKVVYQADQSSAVANFDRLLCSHIGFAISNFARTCWFGLTGGRFISVPQKGRLAPYCKQLTRMSAALAFTSDVALLVLGGDLKRRERLSARLGDVLSYLYMGSAVMRFCREQGETIHDLNSAEWAMQYCLHKIQEAFDEFTNNFPVTWIARTLRAIIFPWGASYRFAPKDKLSHALVESMTTNSEFRTNFTKGVFIGEGMADPTGCIEHAFNAVLAAADAEKKLQKAIKAGKISSKDSLQQQLMFAAKQELLTELEIGLLKAADVAVAKAIAVDDFTSEELAGKRIECIEQAQAAI